MKTALITGIAGQDGSYLAEFLLEKGYRVFGLIRKNENLQNIAHIKDKLTIIEGDLVDSKSLDEAVKKSMPDEIYHLAAISFVGTSWAEPVLVGEVNALGTARLLESVRKFASKAKFFNASTSEMFGTTKNIKTEESSFHPRNPYAISKCYSHWISVNYRESHHLFVCCGILFNHESPRRDETFVTKKIAKAVAEIKTGKRDCLLVGNLDARRDWGFAKDYVEAMWMMLQNTNPKDYIICTGETHTVREFLEAAFACAGINIKSNGMKGIKEEYIREDSNQPVVKISKEFFRPIELDTLRGDNSKIVSELKWHPHVKFEELVKILVDFEIQKYKN